MSVLDNTRTGDMFNTLEQLGEGCTPEETADRVATTQRLIFAAMGADYILASTNTSRTPIDALNQWLNFCQLANPALFGTPEKLAKFKPVMAAVLKDMRDIIRGKL